MPGSNCALFIKYEIQSSLCNTRTGRICADRREINDEVNLDYAEYAKEESGKNGMEVLSHPAVQALNYKPR